MSDLEEKLADLNLEKPVPPADQQIIARFTPKHTKPLISCYNCGNPMESNGFSMCNDCIALSVDITGDLPHISDLLFCKDCGRIQVPPNQWIYAERESRELMGIALKRLKGFHQQGVRFVDAKFIWTEPHSRRTKIKITVQGEVKQYNNLVIQQSYVVEFYEHTGQCPDCAKSYTANTWVATIQIRQKVDHKKTFLYLEQLILKSNAHKDTNSINESREGLDFFYSSKLDAINMVNYLQTVVPIKYKKSEELVSQNTHTGTKSYKFTYSIEIVPICREDFIVLPKKVARSHGNISQVLLCYKVSNNVHLIDPNTLQTTSISAQDYWKNPFTTVANAKTFTEFMVLDIEPAGPATDKFSLADVTVARSSDLGYNDTTFYIRSHLGNILHAGDIVMGYDLTTTNFNHDDWEDLKDEQRPDVILVKKVYPDKPKSNKKRLRRMAKEYNEEFEGSSKKAPGHSKDYEEFLEELENDPELRQELGADEDDDGLEIDMDKIDLNDVDEAF